MKNKTFGFIIIGISALIGFIVFSFNRALTKIVNTACTHGTTCPMWGTIDFQTNISIGIMAFVVLIGLYLIVFSKETIDKQKRITKEKFHQTLKTLSNEEKQIFEKLIEEQGTMFQSDLVEKTGMTKVKITRILDKLEGKGLIERKRRGMTNVIILKV